MKYSRQRECIRENVKSRYDHPTAEMVYQSVKEKYEHISLGTVYRNLSLLVEQGEIQKITVDEGVDRYDGHLEQHYHFLCKSCGRLLDLKMKPLSGLNAQAEEDFDGEIFGHTAYFYGKCGECKGA
mgnify:FL=1